MKKTLVERYKDVKPVGVLELTNFGGLVLLEINGNYAISGFDFGNGPVDVKRTEIQYSDDGRQYIRRFCRRYYFDQIIKIKERE